MAQLQQQNPAGSCTNSWGMLGSAAGPCPALCRGDDRRESFSWISCSLTCFCFFFFVGKQDGPGFFWAAGFGGEGGGNPKTFTFLCKDAVEQLQIHLQLASHPLLPRSSLAGKLQLPSQPLCPSRGCSPEPIPPS